MKKNKPSREPFLKFAYERLDNDRSMSTKGLLEAFLDRGGAHTKVVGSIVGCHYWLKADAHKRFRYDDINKVWKRRN